jgi:hypothetical protein
MTKLDDTLEIKMTDAIKRYEALTSAVAGIALTTEESFRQRLDLLNSTANTAALQGRWHLAGFLMRMYQAQTVFYTFPFESSFTDTLNLVDTGERVLLVGDILFSKEPSGEWLTASGCVPGFRCNHLYSSLSPVIGLPKTFEFIEKWAVADDQVTVKSLYKPLLKEAKS